MITEQVLEAALEAQNAITVEGLKCGCCGLKMKPFAEGEPRLIAELFKRPCECHLEHKCFICGWCLGHCKCGQRFWVD